MIARMQTIIEKIEKMGGVQRFTFEPLIPTSRKSMSKFSDITKEEFSDYLDYLE